jgi:RNA polymerase sigma factor (sigma-70 family)
MDTDNQLLASYARHHSEGAFRELVERHINLVHSAALRESRGNASLAEELTQAVFAELARRATELVRHPALAGWLYTCVRRMAANLRRAEDRRQRREQEALTMNELLGPDPTDQLWHQVRPVLDDAMHDLNEADRAAVVLRYFEGRSLKEVGLALGLTENAARMRVERSLEKLHGLLSRRGVTSTASTLAGVLVVGAAMTAPPALAATIAAGALKTIAAGGSSTITVTKLLSMASTKTAAAGAFLILVAAVVLWHHVRTGRSIPERAAPSPTAIAAPTILGGDSDRNDSSVPTPAPTNSASAAQMAFRLVEAETGQPLANAKLYLFYLLADGRGKVVKAATDAYGMLAIDHPQAPFRALNLFVTADGHVPKVTSWGFTRAMPAEYTMKLERGLTIGGVVVDEAGQPVAGATVGFEDPGNDMSLAENIQYGPDATTTTDANGRWSCNMVPKEYERISVVVTHPDHAETSATVRPAAPDANSSVITMPAGFSVAGTVKNSFDHPVQGATVREVRMNSEGEHSKTTDALGMFEFRGMKAGDLMLAVQAEGYAPSVQTLQVTGSLAAVRFTLGPGHFLRGHITDEVGQPVPNAFIETTRRAIDKIKWSATTDADGRFEWTSAPQEPLLYSVLAEGFNRAYAFQLQADGSDRVVKLTHHNPNKDAIQITGTAVDAETGLPLDGFRVMVGDLDPDWSYPLRFGTSGKDGQFSLSLPANSSHPYYQLQIEKDGYLPRASSNLPNAGGSKTFDFKLKKGSGPAGVVLLPAGEPAVNAAVLLCTTRGGVTIDGPAHVETGLNTTTYRTETDAAGKFSLPAASNPQGIIVIHDQGYAEVSLSDLAATGRVTLQPWGRVEGKLILDSRPAGNERVVAYNHVARYDDTGRRFKFVSYAMEAKTDGEGRFSFDKVPPGQCKVFRQELRSRTGFESHETSVEINPGTVTQVLLGGTGRPITGKAVVLGAAGPINWQDVTVHLTLKTANDLGARPKRADFSSTGAYVEAMDHFFEAVGAQRRFGVFCNSDGSFRLPDIPAGTYKLEIRVQDSKLDSVSPHDASDRPAEIASLVREITVPEAPGGHSDEALDLGLLEVVASQDAASAK